MILARELSLREIARIREESELPVEVFVHGALCVAYSGQCLTSEALGGRSANRGECAQACRLPYEIVCDGEVRDLGDIKYLLSPQDLAAYDLDPRAGRAGRGQPEDRGPAEDARVRRQHHPALPRRRSTRPSPAGPVEFDRREVQEMELSFSRGFSHGFFDGNNHKVLVRGDYAKKRGVFVGEVAAVVGSRIRLDLAAPVKPGDGLVFDGDESAGRPRAGGPGLRGRPVRPPGDRRRPRSAPKGSTAGPAELGFGRRDLDLRRLRPGQRAWKTDDPELTRRLRQSFEGPPRRKVGARPARPGRRRRAAPARGAGRQRSPGRGGRRRAPGRRRQSAGDRRRPPRPVRPARRDDLRTRRLRRRDRGRPDGPPERPQRPPPRPGRAARRRPARTTAVDRRWPRPAGPPAAAPARIPTGVAPDLSALCRTTAQIEAAVAAGIATIYADFQDIKLYREAVAAARAGEGTTIFLATPRIQKPGEANIFRYLAKQGADGLLVRNAGGLLHCAEQDVPFVADFSLNAANELSVAFFKGRGALPGRGLLRPQLRPARRPARARSRRTGWRS